MFYSFLNESVTLYVCAEKNWDLTVPGFSSEGQKHQRKPVSILFLYEDLDMQHDDSVSLCLSFYFSLFFLP